MPKFLYIGQNTKGTTSAMRNSYLQQLFTDWECSVIDTNAVFYQQLPLFQSLAFRFNRGPVITVINKDILQRVAGQEYDLIWIDKGVFIKKYTLSFLKQHTKKLVHYTPDTAFVYHKSHLFNEGIEYYDFLITTKSYELSQYYHHVPKEKVIVVTQGFDRKIHRPYFDFSEKEGIIMIGLYEPERARIVSNLIASGMLVKVAGVGWERFIQQNASYSNLRYLSKGLFGDEYAKAISASLFGLGLLSKKFPEQHTTRTFEIPACGTALVTEDNPELRTFYTKDEVIFFKDDQSMVDQIKYLYQHTEELHSITKKGWEKVTNAGFDYESILKRCLSKMGL